MRQQLVKQHREGIQERRHAQAARRIGEAPERPSLVISEVEEPCAGQNASFMILVRHERSHEPVAGAAITILLATGPGEPRQVHRGLTNPHGFHFAEFAVPEKVPAEAKILVHASCTLGEADSDFPIVVHGGFGRVTAPHPTAAERPSLIVSELGDMRSRAQASFLILVRSEPSCRPIEGAVVRALFPAGTPDPSEIYRDTNDARGFHLAEFRIPESAVSGASLMIQAVCEMGVAEAVMPVLPA